jgi:hypothetical protein
VKSKHKYPLQAAGAKAFHFPGKPAVSELPRQPGQTTGIRSDGSRQEYLIFCLPDRASGRDGFEATSDNAALSEVADFQGKVMGVRNVSLGLFD